MVGGIRPVRLSAVRVVGYQVPPDEAPTIGRPGTSPRVSAAFGVMPPTKPMIDRRSLPRPIAPARRRAKTAVAETSEAVGFWTISLIAMVAILSGTAAGVVAFRVFVV